MKYKSEVIKFDKDHIIDIPDDNIIVKYLYTTINDVILEAERVIVLVPIKEV